MVNTLRVNADHGHDFHPLVHHMTKLKNVKHITVDTT